jgi:hypothetical protein
MLEVLSECRKTTLRFCVFLGVADQHSDPPYPLRLLRARRERPRGRRAAEQREELASSEVWHGLPSGTRRASLAQA